MAITITTIRHRRRLSKSTWLLIVITCFYAWVNSCATTSPSHRTATREEQEPAVASFSHEEEEQEAPPARTISKRKTDADAADTTILVTSSYIPSLPSTRIIDQTMASLHYLQGLSLESTPILIAVDGAYADDQGILARPKTMALAQYVLALQKKYNNESSRYKNVTIIEHATRQQLVGNVRYAMKHHVHTEFVYVIQHDMPFVAPVNHLGLIEVMEQTQSSFDMNDIVRLVRFSSRNTLARSRDRSLQCGERVESTHHLMIKNGHRAPSSSTSPTNNSTTTMIRLSKTHTWSDRNHLTRKSYYDEMFATLPGWHVRYMEKVMEAYGRSNCSYWGTHLYGEIGHEPMIVHLDGRQGQQQQQVDNPPTSITTIN